MDRTFEGLRVPRIDGAKLTAPANEALLEVQSVPCRQTPAGSTFKGQECDGVQILMDDWSRFRPGRTGVALACALRKLYPDHWNADAYDRLLCNAATLDALKRGATGQQLEKGWQTELVRFGERRWANLLYPE